MLKALLRRKPMQLIQELDDGAPHHLKRTLSTFDLVVLGIGGIIAVVQRGIDERGVQAVLHRSGRVSPAHTNRSAG